MMMAACHTVVPEHKNGEIIYQSSSPDEGALVRGAATLQFVFHTRKPQSIVVSVVCLYLIQTNGGSLQLGRDTSVEILNVIEFNSDRKRMSVIVRDEGVLKLYTKGAV